MTTIASIRSAEPLRSGGKSDPCGPARLTDVLSPTLRFPENFVLAAKLPARTNG
jgi:hypothetical protein